MGDCNQVKGLSPPSEPHPRGCPPSLLSPLIIASTSEPVPDTPAPPNSPVDEGDMQEGLSYYPSYSWRANIPVVRFRPNDHNFVWPIGSTPCPILYKPSPVSQGNQQQIFKQEDLSKLAPQPSPSLSRLEQTAATSQTQISQKFLDPAGRRGQDEATRSLMDHPSTSAISVEEFPFTNSLWLQTRGSDGILRLYFNDMMEQRITIDIRADGNGYYADYDSDNYDFIYSDDGDFLEGGGITMQGTLRERAHSRDNDRKRLEGE